MTMMTNIFLDLVMHRGDMFYQITLRLKRFMTMMTNKFLDAVMHGLNMFCQFTIVSNRFVTMIANKFLYVFSMYCFAQRICDNDYKQIF